MRSAPGSVGPTGLGASAPRRRWSRVAGALAVAAGSAALSRHEEPTPGDRRLGESLSRPRGHVVDRLAGAVTDAGSLFGLGGTVAVLAGAGRVPAAVRTVVAGGTAWGVAQAAKGLLRRARPYELGIAERLVHPPAGSSWPSGHAAVAAAMAATLAPRATPSGRVAMIGVAGLVAATRVQLGVHHPTDVVAGAALGVVVAELTAPVSDAVLRRLPGR